MPPASCIVLNRPDYSIYCLTLSNDAPENVPGGHRAIISISLLLFSLFLWRGWRVSTTAQHQLNFSWLRKLRRLFRFCKIFTGFLDTVLLAFQPLLHNQNQSD
jgi:hypothetical protein